MKLFKIDIGKEYKSICYTNSFINAYLCDEIENMVTYPRPGIIIVPGGGYTYCSEREMEPVALRFLAEGFNVFVLDYTCQKKYPAPHFDLTLAMDYITKHAKELKTDLNRLSMIGFSAGAHLVLTYSYLYDELAKMLKITNANLKPKQIAVGYPVVTCFVADKSRTIKTITDNDESLYSKLSPELNITSDYPKTFVFGTKDDELIPFENSTILVEALKKNKVTYKQIVYEHGPHGFCLANRAVYPENRSDYEVLNKLTNWPNEVAKFFYEN